ncbi:MAG: alpha/beta hydrolase [Calditrichaeota bacterium]|nr:MAG: alpha/beta hydrolase [Calditrichota bacterium]
MVGSYGLSERVPYPVLGYLAVRLPGLHALVRWLLKRWRPLVALGLRNIIHDASKITPDLVSEMQQAIRRAGSAPGWQAFLRQEIWLLRPRTCYLDRLGEIGCPVLLVHGEKDRLISVDASRNAAPRFPQAKLVLFPNCGHWPPREYPKKFNRLLLDFLA